MNDGHPTGLVVTVLDKSDYATRFFRLGEVEVKSIPEMYDKVAAKIGKNKIGILYIGDHGNVASFQIGDQEVNNASIGPACEWFRLMSPWFSANGYVHLLACNIGLASYLLSPIAKAFGVRVYAGTGKYNPILRCYYGGIVTCHHPDGTLEKDVSPPGLVPSPSPGPTPAPA